MGKAKKQIRRRNWFVRFIRLPLLIYRHCRISKNIKMAIGLALLSIRRDEIDELFDEDMPDLFDDLFDYDRDDMDDYNWWDDKEWNKE